MSILSEQERDGLDDVFLSISYVRISPAKWFISYYIYSNWKLELKESCIGFLRLFESHKREKSR